jgi:hypothetical protein
VNDPLHLLEGIEAGPGSDPFGEAADLLLDLEELVAPLFDQHLTEECSEEVDITSEGTIFITRPMEGHQI